MGITQKWDQSCRTLVMVLRPIDALFWSASYFSVFAYLFPLVCLLEFFLQPISCDACCVCTCLQSLPASITSIPSPLIVSQHLCSVPRQHCLPFLLLPFSASVYLHKKNLFTGSPFKSSGDNSLCLQWTTDFPLKVSEYLWYFLLRPVSSSSLFFAGMDI